MHSSIVAATCAAVCLSAVSATADDTSRTVVLSEPPKPTSDSIAQKRLFLPSLIGYSLATNVGAVVPLSGIVSYGRSSTTQADGSEASFEIFGLSPSFDVRAGRITIGGTTALMHVSTTGGPSETTFTIAPRIGVLVPLTSTLSLWPRLSVGGMYGVTTDPGQTGSSAPSSGFSVSTDVLLVMGLGSHLFLTVGPSGGWSTASYSSGSVFAKDSGFHIGAGIGIGVAL